MPTSPCAVKGTSLPWIAQRDLTVVIPAKGDDVLYAYQYLEPRLKPGVAAVHVVKNQLYGEAVKRGVQEATTPLIATMDADGQHTPELLWELFGVAATHRPHMCIAQQPRQQGPRATASALLNLAASILAGQRVPDFGSGLRVFRRQDYLDAIDRLPDGFDHNAALTMSFVVGGKSVHWVPLNVGHRLHGVSYVRFIDGLLTLKTLTRCRAL